MIGHLIGRKYMTSKNTYQNIDMEQTGLQIKRMVEAAGYTPKMLQEYLHLSCVQPIYRWYKGKILPSVDHLFMLSELLNVHMESFLVKRTSVNIVCDARRYSVLNGCERYSAYLKLACQMVA